MSEKKKTIALLGNSFQANKSKYTGQILERLNEFGAEVFIEKDFYEYIHPLLGITFPSEKVFSDGHFNTDLAICMGGDGTFLRAAQCVGDKGIPILGVNTGHLGFMSDIVPDDIPQMIDDICNDRYRVEERSVLHVTDSNGKLTLYPYALNEVAVLKQDISSMMRIKAFVNGEYLTTYSADGLIASTPTGSTGYSLSVGGPIVVPQSHSVVLTAVAAHSLNVRPMVFCDDIEIQLSVESRSHSFLVSIDGCSERCDEGEVLKIRKAPYTIKIVKNGRKTYFDTLREKLMWGADLRK